MKKTLLISMMYFFTPTVFAHTQSQLHECIIQAPLPTQTTTAGFFTLEHHGAALKLIAARIPSLTDTVELHKMTHENHVMRMEKIDEYLVDAGEHRFEKGAYHLMLLNLDAQNAPEIGSEHTLTLLFESGDSLSCQAIITPLETIHHHHHH